MKEFNPVFWLMWLLPASAVVAGLTTLGIALHGADRALPEAYHWEGVRLDEDFTRARSAAALGVVVSLYIRDGQCRAVLRNLPTDPASINLALTHGSDAGLDRRLRMARIGAGEYRTACAPLATGRWRIALDDDAAQWAVRGSIDGGFESVEVRARNPDGGAS